MIGAAGVCDGFECASELHLREQVVRAPVLSGSRTMDGSEHDMRNAWRLQPAQLLMTDRSSCEFRMSLQQVTFF